LIVAVVVHAANIQDRDGAKLVLAKVAARAPRLQLVWADGGYAGQLLDWVRDKCGWVLAIIKRADDVKGFQVLPRRWVVERTFAWLGRYRRLSKDYEGCCESSEALILIAMIHLMVRRLAPG
jgi:putative transposase